MKILSIETSCDETAVSILEIAETKDSPDNEVKISILSNIVRSQIELHKEFGGVFPNLAKREHAKNLPIIFMENLKIAGLFKEKENGQGSTSAPITELEELLSHEEGLAQEIVKIFDITEKPKIDYICVTTGPGLEPALWVGINFAKALNLIWNIPIMPVNHMEGHVISPLINSAKNEQNINLSILKFPVLALLISGGHTELVLSKDFLSYEKIGETRDDAVGEAFDKTARLLGLPYPGGPKVSDFAKEGLKRDDIKLPRPMIQTDDFDFSFSGIKTSVLYLVKKLGDLDEQTKKDIAKEFEEAVTEVLVSKTKRAIEEFGAETLIVGGGVSANTFIRKEMGRMLSENFKDVTLLLPDQHLSGDNSLMIALTGYFKIKNGESFPSVKEIYADSNLSL